MVPESGTERKTGGKSATLPLAWAPASRGANMDTQHRELRAQPSAKAPRRAISYIRSFDLPPDEAASLIECDVRGRSCVQAAELLHLSVDGLAKLRRRAYRKIADGQKESTD